MNISKFSIITIEKYVIEMPTYHREKNVIEMHRERNVMQYVPNYGTTRPLCFVMAAELRLFLKSWS